MYLNFFFILAIDIWASGVIMICILSRTENFFRAPNDLTALSEIVTIFGSEKIQQLSKRLGVKMISLFLFTTFFFSFVWLFC